MKWQETVHFMLKIPMSLIGVSISEYNYYYLTTIWTNKMTCAQTSVVQGLLLPIIRDVNSRPFKEIKMALSQLQS